MQAPPLLPLGYQYAAMCPLQGWRLTFASSFALPM